MASSIMSRIFGSGPPQPSMPIQNPGADPANASQVPNGGAANQPAPQPTPLDEFKDIWKTVPAKEGEDPFSKPILTHDPAKLKEAVGKMNFMDGVAPELLTKALAGDAQALTQVINTAVQKSFEAGVGLQTSMIEGSFKTNNERVNSTLPKRIREQQIDSTKSTNPILNHEATAPMLDMAKRAIMNQNPGLNASEVQARAELYITNFGESLQGQKQADATPKYDPYDFSNQ